MSRNFDDTASAFQQKIVGGYARPSPGPASINGGGVPSEAAVSEKIGSKYASLPRGASLALKRPASRPITGHRRGQPVAAFNTLSHAADKTGSRKHVGGGPSGQLEASTAKANDINVSEFLRVYS